MSIAETTIVSREDQKAFMNQSRWGWHVCSKDVFLKLKELKRSYWESVYAVARWKRWVAKMQSNRHGQEPVFNRVWVKERPEWQKKSSHGVVGNIYNVMPTDDHDVNRLFRLARHPFGLRQEPFSSETLKKIDALHQKAFSREALSCQEKQES